jgi:hypothetical protein
MMRLMAFRLEERKDNENGTVSRYPVFGVGRFKTLEEALEVAKCQQPKHGGEIVPVPEQPKGMGRVQKPKRPTGPKRDDRRRDRR